MDKPEPLKLDVLEYDIIDAEWTPLFQWIAAFAFTLLYLGAIVTLVLL